MMTDPYANKPEIVSEPNDWHEFTFQISIDQSVAWDDFDLREWVHTVARYTALKMGKTTIDTEEFEDPELIKTLIMAIKVDRVRFVTDDSLHEMIDSFEE